jgi:hypothetical protein
MNLAGPGPEDVCMYYYLMDPENPEIIEHCWWNPGTPGQRADPIDQDSGQIDMQTMRQQRLALAKKATTEVAQKRAQREDCGKFLSNVLDELRKQNPNVEMPILGKFLDNLKNAEVNYVDPNPRSGGPHAYTHGNMIEFYPQAYQNGISITFADPISGVNRTYRGDLASLALHEEGIGVGPE